METNEIYEEDNLISESFKETVDTNINKKPLVFFRYIGGKSKLAKKIIEIIPKHICYVEVFGGAGNVLLQKTPSEVEVYNDINTDLINLFKVVRENPKELRRLLRLTPFSREELKEKIEKYNKREFKDDIDRAYTFYYMLNTSFSGIIGSNSLSAGKTRNTAKPYFNKIDLIPLISKRLKNVVIENLDFRECIKKYDSETTLFYIDPPYFFEQDEKREYYNSGFSLQDHKDLLSLIKNIKGKWILSGYHSQLYDEELKDYNFIDIDVFASSSYVSSLSKKPRRTEVLWFNYDINEATNTKAKSQNTQKSLEEFS